MATVTPNLNLKKPSSTDKYSINDFNNNMDKLDKVNLPIGSLYYNKTLINPSDYFYGTWTRVTDTFILAAGDTYKAGTSGGEATHTLSTSEMPSHNHVFTQTSCSESGNHTHVVGADKDGGAGTNRYSVHITNNSTSDGAGYQPTSGYAGNHIHTIQGSISATGAGVAHNNMPPYKVYYCWERTA